MSNFDGQWSQNMQLATVSAEYQKNQAALVDQSNQILAAEKAAENRINDRLDEAHNLIAAKERDLVNDLFGFKLGIRGPQIMTLDANVLSNDPLYGMVQSGPQLIKKNTGAFLIASLLIAYLIFGKKRK